ncbi:hypothetical protein FF011L_27710 [Roseimaritima multifibrata]|uniref:Uncharacterized protein n=1 Tax=Roseimaritima multifibrata TaxID=1930274 RepID=A0A517MGI2_9BACT|nr:hypothetical protein FF011L_27710 [Roseimaritima multifibrata]
MVGTCGVMVKRRSPTTPGITRRLDACISMVSIKQEQYRPESLHQLQRWSYPGYDQTDWFLGTSQHACFHSGVLPVSVDCTECISGLSI